MDATMYVIGIAWLAIFVMLGVGAVRGVGRLFLKRPPLPFFAMLKRRGLTYAQVELACGNEELAQALRRCGDCGARWNCGEHTVACPNESVFARARRAAHTGYAEA